MRKFKHWVLVIVLVLAAIFALTSCTVSKKTTKETVKNDSVRIEYREKIIIKDSLVEVIIPADKELLRYYYECDSLGKLQILKIEELEAGKNVTAKIIIKDRYINIDCEVDSMAVYSIYKTRRESFISNISDTSTSIEVSSEKKKMLPWWYIPSLIGCFIFGAIIGKYLF